MAIENLLDDDRDMKTRPPTDLDDEKPKREANPNLLPDEEDKSQKAIDEKNLGRFEEDLEEHDPGNQPS